MSGPPELSLFFGRLHPLLVHLPIGLILLLGLLELLGRFPRFKHATAATGLILALAVPAALASALCGWLLSLGGGYPNPLLQWHKWTGLTTAGLCLAAGLLYGLDLKRLYRWPLAGSLLVLVVASHFGGSLTHGSDYLVKYAPAPLRKLLGVPPAARLAGAGKTAPAQVEVFAGIIRPILEKDCVSCHGPDKAKAKLRLDSYQAILKGGKSGPAAAPGKSGASELVRRVRLPAADEDHMPPEGKPQPTPEQIAMIVWWVDAGAPENGKAGELKPPPEVARILDAWFGRVAPVRKAVAPKPLNEIQPVAARLAEELGIVITALSPNEPWLQCNANVAGAGFGDRELARLSPLFANVRSLDLGGTRVSDSALSNCAAMPNLARLHLERTGITDTGLAALSGLAELEYLDLYGTRVTDAGLEALRGLPRLSQLYLWGTKVTPAAAKSFADSLPEADDIRKWQAEIEALQTRIQEARVVVDVGTSPAAAAVASEPKPVNSACPVSGKPADPANSLVYEGERVAFCCEGCKAKFQQDPRPFLSKLNLTPPNHSKEQSPK